MVKNSQEKIVAPNLVAIIGKRMNESLYCTYLHMSMKQWTHQRMFLMHQYLKKQ